MNNCKRSVEGMETLYMPNNNERTRFYSFCNSFNTFNWLFSIQARHSILIISFTCHSRRNRVGGGAGGGANFILQIYTYQRPCFACHDF